MKKLLFTFLTLTSLLFVSCADDKTIGNVTYKPYGLANEETVKDVNVKYQLSAGSVICAIIFSETIIVPVYVIGWDLYEPVKLND